MARKKRPADSRLSAADLPSEVTLDRLLGALPEQNDLTSLRQALLRASVPDATRAWARSSAYATFDKRVLPPDSLREIVATAAHEEHARIDAMYQAFGDVLASVARGDEVTAGTALIRIGENAEAQDNMRGAIGCFEVAARFSARLPDRKVRILALRHLGRAHLGIGDMETALAYYRAALEQAEAAGETEWQIVTLTGLGNVLGLQGRWHDAIAQYQAARALCADGYPRRRGQLAINLASMHRERGELALAAAELAAGSQLWSDLERSDHSAWYNYSGLVALARGEYESAETNFRQALETAETDFNRAMVLDNLAELFISQTNLPEAETCGRAAEELALKAGAPRALAEIYTRLGKIFRLRADRDGVTFFEKALELCRGRSYLFIEANAYLEYGIFRRILGDIDEARSYLERARQLSVDISATQLQLAASEQLAET